MFSRRHPAAAVEAKNHSGSRAGGQAYVFAAPSCSRRGRRFEFFLALYSLDEIRLPKGFRFGSLLCWIATILHQDREKEKIDEAYTTVVRSRSKARRKKRPPDDEKQASVGKP